jgi:hypothetical protein
MFVPLSPYLVQYQITICSISQHATTSRTDEDDLQSTESPEHLQSELPWADLRTLYPRVKHWLPSSYPAHLRFDVGAERLLRYQLPRTESP